MSADALNIPIIVDLGDGVRELNNFIDSMKDVGAAAINVSAHFSRASSAWGAFVDGAKSAGESIERLGLAYRNVVGPFQDVAEKLVDITRGIVSYAREGQRLDVATRATGLNFQQAARAGTAYVSSLEASTAAMRLHQAGLRLTQQQMDALIAVSTDYATKTGTEVTQAVQQLTDALMGGEQEGLRRFSVALGAVGGDAHTADERLTVLAETAASLGNRVEDIGMRFDRARGQMDEFARDASTGFAAGLSQALARGDAAAARFVEREQQGIATTREWFTAIGEGAEAARQSLSLIADVANVGVSAIAALDGDIQSLNRALDGMRETWSRLRAAMADGVPQAAQQSTGAPPQFEAPAPGQDLASFGNRLMAGLRSTVADAQQALLDPVKFIDRQLGADIMGAAAKFKRQGQGGGDPLASIRAAISAARELSQQEIADAERQTAIRRRDLEIAQLGARTERERARLFEEDTRERERAAREMADVARSELERYADLETLINRRLENAPRRLRSALTAQLQAVESEQRSLQARIEDAETQARRARAERDRAANEAVDRGIERSRDLVRGGRGFTGAAGDRVDEMRAQRAAARTSRALEEQLNREESFTDRMRELHRERIDITGETVSFTEKAYGALSESLATHFQAIAEGSESVGVALQSVLSEVLKALAKEAFVKSAFYLAEGVASLVSYQYDRAAESFAASALFAGAGALASAGAGALAPSKPSTPSATGGGGGERAERAPSASKSGSGDGGTNVVNVMFGGPQYGTGGVRQAAREIAGVLNRGAVQGGVQLNLRAGAGL